MGEEAGVDDEEEDEEEDEDVEEEELTTVGGRPSPPPSDTLPVASLSCGVCCCWNSDQSKVLERPSRRRSRTRLLRCCGCSPEAVGVLVRSQGCRCC